MPDDVERPSSGSQPIYYQPRPPITLDRQTLTIGAVCAILAFLIGVCCSLIGVAFNLGNKSSSLDTLTGEVQQMRKAVDDLTGKYQDNEVKSSNRITAVEMKLTSVENEVLDMKAQLQTQLQPRSRR